MKKALYTLVLLIGLASELHAQCPVGDVTFTTQAEVNAYTFTSCTTISGNLTITDNPLTPTITDLSKLNSITTVTGNVAIKNLAGTSIPGLTSLSSIGGELVIEDNANLTSLGSLAAVATVGNLFISDNDALTSLNGLSGLATVSNISLSNNDNLTSIAGMDNLTTLSGSLNVSQTRMTSFAGLNLVTIQGDLNISNNAELTSLLGLGSLTTISGNLSIDNNAELTSISDIGNLTNVSEISITNNGKLDNCGITVVCDMITNDPDAVGIADNKTGSNCENFEKVEAACSAALPVELTFFKGVAISGSINLTWQTASELGNDYFQIEHSTDGKFFNSVGKVSGNGTTHEVHNYEFRHLSPAKGTHYYRLKQVDKNGKFEYSEIISVVLKRTEISVYPNPTKGILEVLSESTNGNIQVKDSMGKIVASQNLDMSNSINLSYLPKGMYFIEVRTANQTDIKRIIKE